MSKLNTRYDTKHDTALDKTRYVRCDTSNVKETELGRNLQEKCSSDI